MFHPASRLVAFASCIALTVGWVLHIAAQPQTVAVTTPSGDVRGAAMGSVSAFKGLRYAEPPTGEWRWKAPRPVRRWNGVRDAIEFGPACVQTDREHPDVVLGNEDCLRINVWTTARQGAGRPVLFYVHGGSFVGGSGANPAIEGTRLAERGVVVVSINHRLGILGFLGHPDLSTESGYGSGNWGLLDIIEALRWVKGNIAAFGGNPANVTIMGMSSGASALSMVMPSPLARGLFHKAFLQSPGSYRAMGYLRDAETFGLGLARSVAQLRVMSSTDVIKLFKRPDERSLSGFQALRPIVDGYVLERPEGMSFTQRLVPPVPVMLSSAADEGNSFVGAWDMNTVKEFEDFVKKDFSSDADALLKLYAPRRDSEVRQQLAQLFGDTQFGVGARGIAKAMESSGVYRAIFTRKAGDVRPAMHGSDTAYPFGNVPEAASHPTDRLLSELMMNALVRFMQTGSPNGADLPAWSRWTVLGNQEMEFGDTARVRPTIESPGVAALASIMERRLGLSKRVTER